MSRAKSCVVKPQDSVGSNDSSSTSHGNSHGNNHANNHGNSHGNNHGSNNSHTHKEHHGLEQVVRSMIRRSHSFSVKSNRTGSELDLPVEQNGSGPVAGGCGGEGGGGVPTKPRFKMKEETKILLKLHVIREKAVTIDGLLEDLRQLTADCQDEVEECGELQDEFVSKTLKIETEVKLARTLVLLLCKHRPLERHFR
jgi:hypothetical protein